MNPIQISVSVDQIADVELSMASSAILLDQEKRQIPEPCKYIQVLDWKSRDPLLSDDFLSFDKLQEPTKLILSNKDPFKPIGQDISPGTYIFDISLNESNRDIEIKTSLELTIVDPVAQALAEKQTACSDYSQNEIEGPILQSLIY